MALVFNPWIELYSVLLGGEEIPSCWSFFLCSTGFELRAYTLSHSSPFFGDGSLKLFAWVASNHNPLEWLDYRHEPPAPGRSVFLIECQDYGGLRYQNLWAKEDPKTPKPIFPSLGVALPASCKARAFVGARRKPIIRKRLSKIWSSDLGKFIFGEI
jgi:hypothetical protein